MPNAGLGALLALQQPYRDLAFMAGQLLGILVVYLIARGLAGLIRPRGQGAARPLADRAYRAVRLVIRIGFLLLGAAILAFDAYLFASGEAVTTGTLAWFERLPPDFSSVAAVGAAKIAGAALLTLLLVWLARRSLSGLQRRARDWDRITANDAAIDAFFSLLKTVFSTTGWLIFAALAATWLPVTGEVAGLILLALRLYLIAALGLLAVRAIASVVDTLDALSLRLARPDTLLRHYHDLRGLVPLLRRCLELAIWLAVAALVVAQIEPIAAFAAYGPRLIQVVGVFFLARVLAEALGLLIDRSQGGSEGLTEIERQQRATLIPLVKSLGRGAVYFAALAVALAVLDLNPVPLLAGAGALGVVVGFGAQPVITDLVSGFFILFENQFLVGDYVEVGTARGVVESIRLRTTRIRDPNGQQHIVRNGLMTGVVNYSKSYTFAVVEIEFRYDSEPQRIYAALDQIGHAFARENPDVLEPMQIGGIERFTGTGFVVRTTTKVRPGTHGQVARNFRQTLLTAFAERGVTLAATAAPAA